MLKYSKRIILFLDILGFREIVAETQADPEALAELLGALADLRKMSESDGSTGLQITHFSDSVVVSFPVSEPAGVYYLAQEISYLIIDLVGRGYLVRGAVTVGDLIHTNEVLVGPAMVEAYEMESKLAKSPRVIVNDAVIRAARRFHAHQNSPDEEVEFLMSLIAKDADDERLFFDYVSWESVVASSGVDIDEYPDYLKDISKIVERGLRSKQPAVLEKYIWLHSRYVMSLSPQAEEQLPDFKKLAAKALKRVRASKVKKKTKH